MPSDARSPHPRPSEDGLPRGGMTITASRDDVVYELIVRFGLNRGLVTIRSLPNGTLMLSAALGESTS